MHTFTLGFADTVIQKLYSIVKSALKSARRRHKHWL